MLGSSDRFGPARPSRHWARRTAMPPRRSIVEVKVLDVQKRRVPNKHYVSRRPRHAATPAPRRTCAPRPHRRLLNAPRVPAPSLSSVSPSSPAPHALPTISRLAPAPRALPAVSSPAPALPTSAKVWPQQLLATKTETRRETHGGAGLRPPYCLEAPSLVGPTNQAPPPSGHGSVERPFPVTSV